MEVRASANTGAALPANYLRSDIGFSARTKFNLTVNKQYVVYAIDDYEGIVRYYICDDNYIYYPIGIPAPLFEIIDPTHSSHWKSQREPNGLLTLACKEWLSDPLFYEALVDGDVEAIEIFVQIKEQLDAEATRKDSTHST